MEDLDLGATIKGFSPGQKVFKRYTLKKILGRGGMGVVWLAHDEKLDEPVALKFLPDAVKLDAAALDDLKRETKRARQLTHPGIVRIHDFLEDATMAAIAMEAVDGTTFSQLRIERPSRVFEVADIAAWVRQLCAALDYAHTDARVVHRDLKPANIMVDQRGRVKITDFGISQSISDSISRVSAQRASSGTPAYMSPQQMLGGKSAPADDIYSLGATVYELLTGRPPFYAGNLIAQVQSIVPPSLAARRQDLEVTGAPIPAAWEQLVAACLAKEPAGRPRSAAEVLARLGGAAPAADAAAPVDVELELPVNAPAGPPHVVPLPGGGKLELMPVPAGEFVLGSPEAETGRYPEESPRTHVTISRPFWLGRTPVTHGQWRAVMGTGLREQVSQALQDDREYQVDGKTQTLRAQWGMERDADPQRMFGSTSDDVAMYFVSWPEAREFCRRLTELERAAGRLPEGHVFELPTEAQWEYACRAGTRTATPAGPLEIRGQMNAPILDAIAWYGGNSSVRYSGEGWNTAEWKEKQYPGGNAGPRNVGLKRPNAWGLHDMLGNVWEWCADLYTAYPGGAGTDHVGRGSFASRVFRGGAWNAAARDTRAANRNWGLPTARRSTYGMRVALVPVFEVPEAPGAAQPPGAADDARYPEKISPGEPWRVSLPGGAALPLRWVPPGEFTLGSPEGEPGAYDEEGPRTQVKITRGFWLGRTAVTQAQWRAVTGVSLLDQMKRFLTDKRAYKLGGKQQTLSEFWEIPPGTDPATRIGEEAGALPMYYVNWNDAMGFGAKLTALERAAGRLPEGYEYVLPTEAQWEYACRAGTTDAAYGGPVDILGEHNAPGLDAIAWYGGNSSVGFTGSGWATEKWPDKQYPGGNAGVRIVATRQPNPWGLFDMLGNVIEWCFDGYEKYPGGTVADRVANPSGPTRIMRGGGWRSKARDCRAANRNWDYRYAPGLSIGFRVALAPVIADKPAADDVPVAPAAKPAAAPPAPSAESRRDRMVMVGFVALLLLGMLSTCVWTKSSRQGELQRMRTADNAVLSRPETATAAELDEISTHPGRYKELGASMTEIQDLVSRLNQARTAVEQRAASAPASSPTAEELSGMKGVMGVGGGGRSGLSVHFTTVLQPGGRVKSPQGLASDGTDVFASSVLDDGTQAIVRIASTDGTVTKLYPAYNPNSLVVVDDYIYWIDPNSGPATDTQIWKAPKSGQGKPEVIYTGAHLGEPIVDGGGLTADTEYLYAVDQVGGGVTRLRFDGTGFETILPARYEGGFNTEHMNTAASTGSGVVVADSGKAGVIEPQVVFCTANTVSILWSGAPFVEPRGIASDGEMIYVADPGAGNKIWALSITGGEPRALQLTAGTFQKIGSLHYQDNALYAADSATGKILRFTGLPDQKHFLYGRYADEPGIQYTESGLGYQHLEEGTKGDPPKPGDRVVFNFKVFGRNGTLLSLSSESMEYQIDIPTQGLGEGLTLMRPGGRARLLMHAGFGTQSLVPVSPRAPAGVVVELNLLEVKPAK